MTDTSTGETQPLETAESPTVPRVVSARPRKFMWKVLVLIAAGAVSFLIVSQLQGPDRFREQLATENEGDLARILASLSGESNALRDELSALKVQLATVKSSSAEQGADAAQVEQQINALRVLAGTTPVTGPGIELVIEDPDRQVTYDVLVDAVQELRDAGAEAMAINGRRIGVSSAFVQVEGRIQLDGVTLPVPYTVNAIGPAATMEGGLKIPGGALDALQALNGVATDLHRVNTLTLPALARASS